jgi:hypothetical protein
MWPNGTLRDNSHVNLKILHRFIFIYKTLYMIKNKFTKNGIHSYTMLRFLRNQPFSFQFFDYIWTMLFLGKLFETKSFLIICLFWSKFLVGATFSSISVKKKKCAQLKQRAIFNPILKFLKMLIKWSFDPMIRSKYQMIIWSNYFFFETHGYIFYFFLFSAFLIFFFENTPTALKKTVFF